MERVRIIVFELYPDNLGELIITEDLNSHVDELTKDRAGRVVLDTILNRSIGNHSILPLVGQWYGGGYVDS